VKHELEQSLQDAWETGRAAWPDVVVEPQLFAKHLLSRIPDDAAPAVVASLNCADLYLACACANRTPGALETFDRTLMARVPDFIRRIDPSPEFADEVRQTLFEKLFVTSETGAKIVGYNGEAPLLSWLRVVALRAALNLASMRHPERNAPLDDTALAALETEGPELEYLKRQYRDEFQAAVRAALGDLSTQQRRVLRMHLSARLSTPQIGALLRVHHTTVVRWLASAREAIRTTVRQRLREQLGLDSEEFESITGVLLSRLDVSIESCLRESKDGVSEGQ
jgi:RNA polymerase sigma-70 factor (ECF subfamily)